MIKVEKLVFIVDDIPEAYFGDYNGIKSMYHLSSKNYPRFFVSKNRIIDKDVDTKVKK